MPRWWWLFALASCGPTPAYAAPFSTTSWSVSDAAFAESVSVYFEQAIVCQQQKRIPSPGLMKNEVLGFIAAQERWWPARIDYRDRLFAVMASEGHGLMGGNPDDPSYGVMHITYLAARTSVTDWNIPAPQRERDFIKKLQEDSRFCILVAAGWLRSLECGFGGDWFRAVGSYKCGTKKFSDLMRQYPTRPVTDFDMIRDHLWRIKALDCVSAYTRMGTRMKDCQCLSGQP